MAPRCGVCLEDNVEAGHEQSQKHLKNLLLDQLGKINKIYAENRNGIVVSSTVTPVAYNAAPLHVNTEQSVLKVSVKPREGVNFTFKIKNDNAEGDIIFRGISIPNNKFNFTLLSEDLNFGSVSCRIHPRTLMEEEVCVTFENSVNGVYKQPVYFIFIHADTEEYTVILKEMLVFVEAVKRKHEKVDSPYTLQPVLADKLERTTAHKKGEDDVFVIPSKALKKMFARDLKVDNEDVTDEEKALAEKVKAIFEAGPDELNYIQFFHNLLWYEETVIAANLKNYNMSGVMLKRSLTGKSYSLLVPGLAEKRPSLMLGDLVYVRPHNKTEVMYEAIITDILDNYAQFSKISDKFHKLYKSDEKFDIRFCMSRMPLERMHVAVDDMLRQLMQTKTFPKGNERVPPIKRISNFYNPLIANNPEQHAVVEHIVAGSSGTAPYLLHGPPGTGKTVTIVEAILQLAKTRTNRILVCTDSNMAADHVATLLIQYADKFPKEEFLLRANSEFRVWETMPAILGPYSNGTSRQSWTRVTIAKFMTYSIVITTLVHAAKFAKDLKQKKHERVTTHVFIDEAAQASEPASLIPLCGLLQPGGALVLAGDPLQLGPVVISREASKLGLGECSNSPEPASLIPLCGLLQPGGALVLAGDPLQLGPVVISRESVMCSTHLFIDEAAQASEPASLIPLCGLLQPGGALVLAGDPLQLGPVSVMCSTHLFIDEAAQASEPASLIPLCGLLQPGGALVLAGDPLQLGPVSVMCSTHLFIDEAAQASEPASLIPLCGLLQPGGALVLAGDPLQLGPVSVMCSTHLFIDEAAQASEPASLIPLCGLLLPGGALVLAGDPLQLGPVSVMCSTHLFIDEAAQASEPASLIPLCGLLQPGGALVLAGDPLQLGPVVISREASKLGLGISLMERLKRDCALYSDDRRDPNYIMMLKKNFRSHRDILSIPDELFYHGQLEAMAPVDYISSVDILGERTSSRAIVFYGVPSQEQRIGKSPSFYNDSELEVVQRHITALLEVHRVAEADIGVVTPYIRQVYKIKQWLKALELNIEVGTVEGFQGKEKRIILVSTVRAKCELLAHDAKFRLGFLVDAKRFNVALTRAKAKLIVIGNPSCLQKDAKWHRYITRCRELGTYCGFDLRETEADETEAIDQITQILRLTKALENMRV
ncbi:putative helicase mov-10-B.1 [Cydia pomonella]|uniref:putative helicase mov-10-B.1 n=1 Tax=Cydia pomonella TaxID=82600 RepID=UPI002ADE77CF|nr:putative helicase mov-10-B.1 [Cydia pomonella]